MKNDRWVIATSSGVDVSTLSQEQRYGYIGLACSDEIYSAVIDSRPEYLAIDLIMPGGDAWELAKRISLSRIEALPITIVMVPDGLMNVANEIVKDMGVHAIIRKPVTGGDLRDAVDKTTIADRLARHAADKRKLTRILWKLGFSPAVNGYKYVYKAVELVSRDRRAIKNMSKSLYPVIADIYGEDEKRVEGAMRRAAESAWSSGSPEAQYDLFGNSIDECRGKPTLAEMFACIAERLYAGMEIDI